MAKKKKTLLGFSFVLLSLISIGGTFAGFYFTDLPATLISDLDQTIYEEEDQTVVDQLERTERQLSQATNDSNALKREQVVLSEELEAKQRDTQAREEELKQEQAFVKIQVRSTGTEVKRRQVLVERKILSAEIKNISELEPIFLKAQEQLEAIGRVSKELDEHVQSLQALHEEVEAKFLAFQKGLGRKSNFKEFLLYIFGLKIL